MQKILYLHAGAEMYGADKVLLELIKGLDKDAFEAHVILPNDGILVGALEEVGGNLKRNFEREGVVVAEVAYNY